MSPLTSVIAVSWSTVSVKPNASSISACHGVSGPNAWPGEACRLAYSDTSSAGDLPDRPAGLGLRVGPVAAAEPAQRRRLTADIARQLVKRVHRHVEPVGSAAALARRVLEHQVLAARAADHPFRHLDEPADAVLVVHHQVAGGQRQRVDDVAALGGQPLALGGGGPVAGQVGLGDHDEVGARQHHAVVQRALEHADDARLRARRPAPTSLRACRIRRAARRRGARCRCRG